jgi:hypothetical protein
MLPVIEAWSSSRPDAERRMGRICTSRFGPIRRPDGQGGRTGRLELAQERPQRRRTLVCLGVLPQC